MRCPSSTASFLRNLRERIPNSDKAVWSVHCHNDLGMAVANSLAGVKIGGARQIECTINGLGERAGNCSLEEVVMAVRTRRDFFGLEVGIDTTQIVPASKLVSGITGFPVQPNKAVVGANAFAHASGIHQDGVLKARDTYEIMRAEDVGWHANRIVLGKLSGRNAFKQRVQELAIPIESEADLNAAFARFKELADRKTEIFDEDIQALFSDETVTPHDEHFKLLSLSQHSETGERPHARVVMTIGAQEVMAESDGNGPVDATLKAIESQVKSGSELLLLLGQCDHDGHRIAGRGDGAAVARRPHRQRRRRRSRHRRRIRQGLSECTEQALQRRRAAEPADVARAHDA